MPQTHEIPGEVMSRTVVNTDLSEDGFGVSEICQKVPFEDEDDEFRLGHTTGDVCEGEDKYEEVWEDLGEDTEYVCV
jgi:hypothetical protein